MALPLPFPYLKSVLKFQLNLLLCQPSQRVALKTHFSFIFLTTPLACYYHRSVFFSFSLRLLLLTHFGESPVYENLFPPIFWHNQKIYAKKNLGNFIFFYEKKPIFFSVFFTFCGQLSVSAAWATRSPQIILEDLGSRGLPWVALYPLLNTFHQQEVHHIWCFCIKQSTSYYYQKLPRAVPQPIGLFLFSIEFGWG